MKELFPLLTESIECYGFREESLRNPMSFNYTEEPQYHQHVLHPELGKIIAPHFRASWRSGDQDYHFVSRLSGVDSSGKSYRFTDASGEWKHSTPVWNTEFHNASSSSGSSVGLTGTGNAHHVLSHVADTMHKFLTQVKPVRISFSAKEPSRVRLYSRMVPHIESHGYKITSKSEGKFKGGRTFKFKRVVE